MKFLMTYASKPNAAPPSPEKLAELGKYTAEMIQSGTVLMTGGLVRPTKGTQVKLAGGKFSVTDGPFAETKELIDGFALIKAASKEEAIEHARRFMSIAGEGEGEILQVFEYGDGASQ
ncbi:MAG: YciI family protein [Polyangiaceae bacterium]